MGPQGADWRRPMKWPDHGAGWWCPVMATGGGALVSCWPERFPPRPTVHPIRLFSGLLLALALASLAIPATAAGKPVGLRMKVSANGIFVQTINAITVTSVDPGSQALEAGIQARDELVRVNGVQVPGTKALDLRPHLQFPPGVPVKLQFKRGDGTLVDAVLTEPAK